MRTLIVSDFHLGLRTGADVLRRPEPLEQLLAAIDGIQRLVLLGDALELGASTARAPKPDAERVLRTIGERLGPKRSVVVVPGNHDGRLVRAWALSREAELGIADEVPPDATPALAALTSWLAPARVRVSYPGVWLEDRVFATHGHYLDRHLIPESAFGLLRSAVAQAIGRGSASTLQPARPIDYEWARRRATARRRRRAQRDGFATRLRERPLGTLIQTVMELAREGAMPQIPRLMMRAGLTPATARLADAQMRRSAVPAMAEVARQLGVDADWIVFGHVHRLGPRDEPAWQPLAGGPRLLNTGAWLFEPMLVDQATPPHPYWPGGAVLLEPGAAPRAIGLLDDLTPAQLNGPLVSEPQVTPTARAISRPSESPAPDAPAALASAFSSSGDEGPRPGGGDDQRPKIVTVPPGR